VYVYHAEADHALTNLEDTLAITEGRDVSSSVLLVHGLASEDLSNHVAHDTHLGSTAVVELNIELAGLLLRVLDVSAEVPNTIVTVVLGRRHPGELDKGEESKDLGKTSGGDGTDSVNASGDIRELEVVGGGKVSIEDNVVVVDDGANDGSHGNTAVLALDSTTALEGLRLGLKPAKGIKDTNSKMKLAVAALLIGSAAAFAPIAQPAFKTTALGVVAGGPDGTAAKSKEEDLELTLQVILGALGEEGDEPKAEEAKEE